MLASSAREALALALASLEDPALDEVRLDRAQLVGKEVHAVFACPSACHAAASRALTRAAGHLANELAMELDRKRALRLAWSLVTDEELGSDLGCGVAAVRLTDSCESLRDAARARRALAAIARAIPIQRHPTLPAHDLDATDGDAVERALSRGASPHELGTLGRGNHFVELREARDDGSLWWLAHTGSRSFGPRLQAAQRTRSTERAAGFAVLDAQGEVGTRYLDDVACAVAWARLNRRIVLARVLDALGDTLALDPDLEHAIDTCHDSLTHERHALAGREEWLFVHRRGAMRLAPGERGLVPGSMGADVAIVRARADAPASALGSSAHGAGRAIPRMRAARRFDVGDLAASMRGVLFDARLARGLLDEIPHAYKDLDDVLRAERALVRCEARLAPLLVHKGTG